MGDHLIREGQVDALVDVQVAPFDMFGVEYKEFVQFIFKLLSVAECNARRPNPRHDIECADAVLVRLREWAADKPSSSSQNPIEKALEGLGAGDRALGPSDMRNPRVGKRVNLIYLLL